MMNGQPQRPSAVSEPKDFYKNEVPERLQDDPLISYFRCRYSEREALLTSYEKRFAKKRYKFERIEQELTRIDQLRSEFDKSHERYMDRLRSSRATWVQQAKKRCRGETAQVRNIIRELEARGDDEARELLLRKHYELGILERVPDMPTEYPSMTNPIKTAASSASAESQESAAATLPAMENHTVPTSRSMDAAGSQVEPDHGFMVNMITLERESSSSSYVKFGMEKYPVNEALDGKPHRQLRQRCKQCEPNTLRYFHFPANNMDWIEV